MRTTMRNSGGPITPSVNNSRTVALLVRSVLDAFDDGRDPLPHPDAHRGEAVATAGPAQLVAEHRDQPRSAHPERMAQRDRAAVHVDLCRIQPEVVDADEGLRR